jgi:hypothetical protein
LQLQAKLARIAAREVRWSELELEHAELVVLAFWLSVAVYPQDLQTAI